MEKKLFYKILILNSIFLALTVVTDVLYMTLGNAYIFKTLASLTFVVCCFCNIITMLKAKKIKNKKFFALLFAGQVFAMAGDILLINFFEIGAGLFAVGHIFYFLSYLTLQKFKLIDLAFIIGALAVAFTVIFTTVQDFQGMMILIIIYAIIISTMLGKSASLFLSDKKTATLIFIGSLMFFLSDMFLMFEKFVSMGPITGILCLAFYYPAQFVLATSPAIACRDK